MWYRHKNRFRLILGLAALASALFGWPWMTFVFMTMLAARFAAWEVIVLGMCIDFIFTPTTFAHPFPIYSIAALLLVWGLEPLRKEFLSST